MSISPVTPLAYGDFAAACAQITWFILDQQATAEAALEAETYKADPLPQRQLMGGALDMIQNFG